MMRRRRRNRRMAPPKAKKREGCGRVKAMIKEPPRPPSPCGCARAPFPLGQHHRGPNLYLFVFKKLLFKIV